MGYNYSNLTGAILLRADSNSQNTKINIDSYEKDLISDELFWGTQEKPGLYYDYKDQNNKFGYSVSCEGWNDYSEKDTEKMSINDTIRWVEDNILNYNGISLGVIQGYAGCGKTTFVHSILRNISVKEKFSSYYNFYIGHIKNSTEKNYIKSSIMSKIAEHIISALKEDDGWQIYEQFVELCKNDLSILSSDFQMHFAPIYYSCSNASLYSHALNLYKNRKNDNASEYEVKFRVQFNNSYNSKMGILRYRNDHANINNEPLDILLVVDYIWRCSVSLVRNTSNSSNQIVVYDNLDIIDDIQVVVEFIDTLRSVLTNYELFKFQNDKLSFPTFKAILTVRKITYASISRFSEVGSSETHQTPVGIDFLDISNLYISSNVLKHKAKVLIDNLNSIIPYNSLCYNNICSFLKKLIEVPDDVFSDIKFSELLNHNIRACANMMELVISSNIYNYSDSSASINHSNGKQTSAIWIHIICTILKDYRIWESLGYNLSNTSNLYYPTTLSRMILTYLCNYRLGYMRDFPCFKSSDVTFKEIVASLERIPFNTYSKNLSWKHNVAHSLKKEYKKINSQKQVIHYISKMLQRNDSMEELELWRRPIYFTRNAISLTDIQEINDSLEKQLQEDNPITSFCITDEGCTFVEKIATHFEFYSVRYNNRATKPICFIRDCDILDKIIERVYNQVSFCADKQVWLMNYYKNNIDSSINRYLNELYHPRTEGFKPQLHIVRTIFDHIIYLNDYRDSVLETHTESHNINECLVKWIGKYLNLYRQNWFDMLKNTVGEYNNNVWLDLKYLYWLVTQDKDKKGINFIEGNYITISRNSNIMRVKQENYPSNYRIADDVLLDK